MEALCRHSVEEVGAFGEQVVELGREVYVLVESVYGAEVEGNDVGEVSRRGVVDHAL